MKPCLLPLVGMVTVASLLITGCAPLSPGETTGPFSGENAQFAAANINRASTASTGERLSGSGPVATTANAVTAIIAKHQASVRQREIAAKRARATYAKLVAKHAASTKSAATSAPSHVKPKTGTKSKPEQKVADVRLPRPYRIPRYIAVETEKDKNTSPKAQKAVMIWDTEAQEIVGNNVYDIGTPPAVGTTSRFETFSAEYVGAGL